MKSRDRVGPSFLALSVPLFALLAAAACSSTGSPATGGSGGSSPTAGSGGTATASGGTSAGTTGSAGTNASGGTVATGGAATGGGGAGIGGAGIGGGAGTGTGTGGGTAGTGAGGVTSGGQGGASGGSAGGSGGAVSCVGRSLSLAANGTSSDSDAAYSRVVIDLASALPTGNSSRTVEFWAYIKTTDWVGDKNELYYYGASGTTTAFGMDFGTNPVAGMASNHATLNPFTDGGFNVDSTADLGITSSSDQWVHIAMTWNGTALLTYVNGTLGITSNGTGGTTMLATAAGSLMIGCNPENKACFNGLVDEFSIWNVARTATDLKNTYKHPLVGNETGLVGYWKFDDAPGSTTAADSLTGGTAHAGTLMAAAPAQPPTFVTAPTPPPLVCP